MEFLNKTIDLLDFATKNHQKYHTATPFPHIILKDFFNPEILNKIEEEFPDLSKSDAKKFNTPLEKKFGGRGDKLFSDTTKKFMDKLNSKDFRDFLQKLTGIEEELLDDSYYEGGGLHENKRGGVLKIHADFNKHTITKLDRRLNLIVYLNKNWLDEYGGHLELWTPDMKKCVHKVPPTFNTAVIFSTTDYSYHGYPDPIQCPEDRRRKSLALYYYSDGRPQSEINPDLKEHRTLFKARHNNEVDEKDFNDAHSSKKLSQKIKRLFKKITQK